MKTTRRKFLSRLGAGSAAVVASAAFMLTGREDYAVHHLGHRGYNIFTANGDLKCWVPETAVVQGLISLPPIKTTIICSYDPRIHPSGSYR